jgi:membrane-bound lytic murein transglycosylase D
MRFLAAALIFFGVAASYGQTPEVPHKMQFAGMTLTIRDDARREIQADVDALTRSPKYFAIKAERAKTYFPIIEKIFAEERVPDDFKYLSLQESALVSDAVSVSNAVGFWQFKDFTAMEMGMRVDKEIDERMNLMAASRGAARYIKQNNYFFNNWIYALQSYQMGAGGVQRAVGDQHNGATHMDITSDTYWYVKKYLAHKVAFEGAVQGEGQVKVVPYEIKSEKTLKEVSLASSTDEAKLMEYNKWIKNGIIPTDKTYTVLIPMGSLNENFTKLTLPSAVAVSKVEQASSARESKASTAEKDINGIPVLYAAPGETVVQLAQRGNIDLGDFIKYNEIAIDQPIIAGDVFFLSKKKSKASENFYAVKPGDNLWRISQLYGVTIKKLEKYNRISSDQKLAIGTEVWLSEMKPKEENLPSSDRVVQLDDETFDWGVKDKEERREPLVPKNAAPETITVIVDAGAMPADKPEENSEISVVRAGAHVVQKGDTFYSIAKLYSMDVMDLLSINQLKIQDGLKVGQVLKTSVDESVVIAQGSPLEAPKESHTLLHEVKISDTLYSIARQYQVTIKEIMDWNGKNDFALTIGEKLKIVQQ